MFSVQGTYQKITGTFTVPKPSNPDGDATIHSASAWVGIDGNTCASAILQTGVDFNVDTTGIATYDGS